MPKKDIERVISASEEVDASAFNLPLFANARHIVKHRQRDAERIPVPKKPAATEQPQADLQQPAQPTPSSELTPTPESISTPAPTPAQPQQAATEPGVVPAPPIPSSDPAPAVPAPQQDAGQLQEQGFQAGFNEGKQLGWQTGLEEGKTAGYQEGLNGGREAGYQEGLQQGQVAAVDELHKQVGRLQQLISTLYDPIASQDEALTQQLVNITITIAKQVIQRELQVDSSQVTTVVKAAIQAMPITDQQIKIFLNPQDMELINEHITQQGEDWQLLADEQLLPGGCRVETANSLVDASVEARLRQITEKLAEQHLHTHAQTIQQQPAEVAAPPIDNQQTAQDDNLSNSVNGAT